MVDTINKTALDVITGAFRKIGVYAQGETISAADGAAALDALNGFLDILSLQHFSVYNNIETTFSMAPGKSSYTVGIGGDVNVERPLRITRAYSRITTGSSPVDFPCDIWPIEQYADIGMKGQPGPWPKVLYYNTSFPLAQLIFWPVPNQVAEFHFWSDQVLSTLSLAQQLNLPRGYYLYLQYALAELLAPDYGMPVPPDVRRMAADFRAALKSLNARPQQEAPIDAAIVSTSGHDAGFILHGGF